MDSGKIGAFFDFETKKQGTGNKLLTDIEAIWEMLDLALKKGKF
ncbi:MAG: hypothetical protein ABH864_06965 [archaeon]